MLYTVTGWRPQEFFTAFHIYSCMKAECGHSHTDRPCLSTSPGWRLTDYNAAKCHTFPDGNTLSSGYRTVWYLSTNVQTVKTTVASNCGSTQQCGIKMPLRIQNTHKKAHKNVKQIYTTVNRIFRDNPSNSC